MTGGSTPCTVEGMAGTSPAARKGVLSLPVPDVVLAALLTVAQLALTRASAHWAHGTMPGVRDYVVLGIGGAVLAVRQRYPVGVLAAALITTFLVRAVGHVAVAWVTLIAAFVNAVIARRRAAAIISLLCGYLISVWPPWLIGRPGEPGLLSALGLAVFLLFLLGGAELIRMRSQRAAAVARSRDEELRRHASEERIRIARDLHDVVAHNIAVINVQANTALHLMDRQPERARMALSTINDVSKQALVELRSVVGVLREAGEEVPHSPAPGLDRLDELMSRAQAAGLTVKLEVTGERVTLPANVGLAAYRIIQEALTNSAKYAAGSVATTRISYGTEELAVEVIDDGRVTAPVPARPVKMSGGNGLAGMRERVSALGGTLQAGPRPEGGFRVHACLPLRGLVNCRTGLPPTA
jgi:signal transduction histidine kinase